MGFFSVGHSNRSLDEFVEILTEASVDLIVDIRAFPMSRTNPEYNRDALPSALASFDIGYEHWPDLGGRRPRQPDVPEERNALWRNRSFHNYADYALSDAFKQAFDALVARGRTARLAMMCSEAVWWRCHRRIITDHLILRHHQVLHLMGGGRPELAKVTPGAILSRKGDIVYPPQSVLHAKCCGPSVSRARSEPGIVSGVFPQDGGSDGRIRSQPDIQNQR